jgi:Ca2+-binding RTX toxin-like protein
VGSVSAYMPLFLSQPATTRTTVRYETLAGSAGTDDFSNASGTIVFERGQDSGYLRLIVRGDSLIEGDETFQVRFTDITNAEFVDGGTSATATVRILDDDDATGGTAGGLALDFVYPGSTSGRDVLYGTPGYDVIDGRGGDDYIYADGGNDRLYGGAGADTINGGGGDDRMFGGLGNDRYVVHSAGDLVLGETGFSLGGGIDTVLSYVTYTLPSNVEILRLQGGFNLWGYGNFAPNALVGNTGDNTLDGGGGNDAITAKAGDDVLRGGLGSDLLMGNEGADVFDFNSVAESPAGRDARDFINGFTHGLDRIDLSSIDANPYASGNQAFRFIGDDDFSARGRASAGELQFKHYDGDFVIVGADVTGNGQADMQIFVNLTTYMTGSDFML